MTQNLECRADAPVLQVLASAWDLASVITLANELRAALVEKGLVKGGA
ncbi:MAG: hypothetical protein JNK85_29530 [Verrucomicrobiales bacterium]|nr:hypothetical protein [Verrucomicrobiales bacterium]